MNPPMFAHGHLRLTILSLLGESPRHGYDIMQAISERFHGTYSPSAGTIYPRLAKLEADGLVTKRADGRKTVYEITDAGRAELAGRRDELHDIDHNLEGTVADIGRMVRERVTAATAQLRAELGMGLGGEDGRRGEAAGETAEKAETPAKAKGTADGIDGADGADASNNPNNTEEGDARSGQAKPENDRGVPDAGHDSGAVFRRFAERAREDAIRDARDMAREARLAADNAAALAARTWDRLMSGELGDVARAASASASASDDQARAELAVERTRQELRANIRQAAREGRLSPALVAGLEAELERTRVAFARSIGLHG